MRHIKIKSKGLIAAAGVFLTSPLAAATGTVQADKNWFLLDGTFWVLTIVALLMMYVIYALGEVVIWGAKKKTENQKKTSGGINKVLILIGFTFLAGQLSAQAVAPVQAAETVKESLWASPYLPLYILIFIEVCVITYLTLMLYQLSKKEKTYIAAEKHQSWLAKTWEKWNYKVPVEREDEILLDDHDYDGIHELDNSLPPWLNYIFIVSFIFAVIYFIFHFFNISPTQDELYAESVIQAEAELAEYRAQASDFYDENSVILDKTDAVVDAGKTTFTQYCVACHGAGGEGGVGPNLTDNYWIHGGTINDLFKTVKYGVQEKGMASWKDILSPKQIFEVTNYIKTLYGTNPPNAKEPQGVIFVEGAAADSTGTPGMPADTMKKITDTMNVAVK